MAFVVDVKKGKTIPGFAGTTVSITRPEEDDD